MRQRVLAQEDNNEGLETVENLEQLQEHADAEAGIEAAAADVESRSESIEEGEALGDVLEAQAAQVDEMAEAGEEPSEAAVLAVEAFLDFACTRLAAKKPVRLGLENYSTAQGKRERLKLAAEEIRALNDLRERGVILAQEGLADSLKEFFEVTFTNTSKLRIRLRSAMALSDQKDGKAEGELDAVWAKSLGGGTVVNSNEVIATAKRYSNAFGQAGLPSILQKMEDSIRRGTSVVRSIWFWSNKKEIAVLDNLTSDLQEELDSLELKEQTNHERGAVRARVLTKEEAKHLADALEKMLETDALEKQMSKIANADTSSALWSWLNAGFRIKNGLIALVPANLGVPAKVIAELFKIQRALLAAPSKEEEFLARARAFLNAEDLAKAREIAARAMRARASFTLTIRNRNYFTNAAIKYIIESANRRGSAH